MTRALTGGYATQVKAFLALLVLFLAVAVYGDRRLVGVAREAVLAETGERLGVEADLLRAELERDQMLRPSANGGEPTYIPPAVLDRIARLRGLVRFDVIGVDGRVVTSSEAARVGRIDPMLADPADRRRLMLLAGRTVVTPLETLSAALHDTLGAYRPIRDRARATVGFIHVEREVVALAEVDRSLRALAALQTAGLAFVAILVILFARWLLRPYRSLQRAAVEAAAAGAAPVSGSKGNGDEAEALVQAFQGVLEKLRGQEAELHGLKTRAAGTAPVAAERLLSGMASAALVFDASGRLTSLNAAATSLLGLDPPASIGRGIDDLLAGSPRLADLVRTALERGEGRTREVVSLRAPDGRACHLGAMLSPIHDAATDGAHRPDGVVCLLTDLTEIRALRERARFKESLAALGELSAGIAHEFRNALAVILGHARLVDRSTGADTAVGGHAQAILREVRRLQEVVNDFLRFARQESPANHPVDTRALCADLAGDFRADPRNAGIELAVEGSFPPLVADEPLLRQALLNLLRNAAEAAGDAGAAGRRVRLRCDRTAGEQVRFEVADEGPGIEAERLPHLFTPFYTTKDGGTGLGLALVRKVAAMHDGQAEAASTPGKGTVIVLTLPARPGASPALDLVA